MDTDSEGGFLPFRRKHLTDVFSSRTGSFSPRGNRRSSQIPRNSLEFEPSSSLFADGSGCGCRRAYTRHRRMIHRLTAILVCLIFFAVIIGPLAWHFSRPYDEAKPESIVKRPDTVTDKSPRQPGGGGGMGLDERSEEEQEESAEALPPYDGAPPAQQRVVAEVLEDSRDHGRPPPTEEPDSDFAQMIVQEINAMPGRYHAGDVLTKVRSRRELDKQRQAANEELNEVQLEENYNETENMETTEAQLDGLVSPQNDSEQLNIPDTSVDASNNDLPASPEPPSQDKVHNSVSSNTIARSPVSRHLEFPEWQELEHYLKFPEQIRSHSTEDNVVDSHEIEEALEEAKVLRKRLALAKMRYKRTLPGRRYSGRKYFKEDCNGLDCNDDVGSARIRGNSFMTVEEKLEALLADIREVRKKFSSYEKRLKGITHPPFEDFSLAYPTLPPPYYRPPMDFNNIDYPEFFPPMPSNNMPDTHVMPIPAQQNVDHNAIQENDVDNEIDSSDDDGKKLFTHAPPVAQSTAHDSPSMAFDTEETEATSSAGFAENDSTSEKNIQENPTTPLEQTTHAPSVTQSTMHDSPTMAFATEETEATSSAGFAENDSPSEKNIQENPTTPLEQTTKTIVNGATDSTDDPASTTVATVESSKTTFDDNVRTTTLTSSTSNNFSNDAVSSDSSGPQDTTTTLPATVNEGIEDQKKTFSSSTQSEPETGSTDSAEKVTTVGTDVDSTAHLATSVDDGMVSSNGLLTESSTKSATSTTVIANEADVTETPVYVSSTEILLSASVVTDSNLATLNPSAPEKDFMAEITTKETIPEVTEGTVTTGVKSFAVTDSNLATLNPSAPEKDFKAEITTKETIPEVTEGPVTTDVTSSRENTNNALLTIGDGVTKSMLNRDGDLTSETVLTGEPAVDESVTEISSTPSVNRKIELIPDQEASLHLSTSTSESSAISDATFASISPTLTDATENVAHENVDESTSESPTERVPDQTGKPELDLDSSVEKVNSNEDENFVKTVNNGDSEEGEPPFGPIGKGLVEGEEQTQDLSAETNEDEQKSRKTDTGLEDPSKGKVTVREAATEKSSDVDDFAKFTEITPTSQAPTSSSAENNNRQVGTSTTTASAVIEQETEKLAESEGSSNVTAEFSDETTLGFNEVADEITPPTTFDPSNVKDNADPVNSSEILTINLPVAESSLPKNTVKEEPIGEGGIQLDGVTAPSQQIHEETMDAKEAERTEETMDAKEAETTEKTVEKALSLTTPIGSIDEEDDAEDQILTRSKIHHDLEHKMFAENQDNNVTPHPDSGLHGMSLDEVRNRKQASKKFESKVVTMSSDIAVPTGPDSAMGVGETSNSGQQLSYSPYQSFAVPFQICYYANQPAKHIIEPRVTQSKTFPLLQPSFHLPPLVLPGANEPAAAKPGAANIYNIVMTNPPAAPSQPHVPMLFSPGVMTFPPQQNIARYMTGQQALLFCSAMHSQYQSPTMPGTAEFSHSRCRNCDDDSFMKKQGSEQYPEELDVNQGTLECPEGLSRCKDDQLCIPSAHWCDGRVQCGDASDEMHCSCRDRISEAKRCDGYTDCPNAEDEAGCDDCPSTSFSCGTWDETGACVPLSKRCDGTTDCTNGRDELHCSMLSPSVQNVSNHVNYMDGFLLRNWRGEWYPVCMESGRQSWAMQACEVDGDPEIDQRDLPEYVRGPFLTHRSDDDFVLEHHCKGHVATHVTCPAHRCGTRATNPPPTDMASRFRRLVENHEAPTDAAERPIQEWWEKTKHKIESEYHVQDVTARIFPLAEETGSSRMGRSVGNSGRVVGGKASSPNAWPWAVALYKDGLFHCGGTLLDSEWVLTAAHCVVNFMDHYYEANIGMLRRFSFAPMQKVVPIGKIIVHADYEPKTMKNDIAMMRLREPVVMNRWVHPTCLPTSARNRQGMWAPAPGTKCVAVGWGAVKEHGTDPDHLREVEVPILPSCKHREDIEGDEICAGLVQGGKDTCQGDSGGPLMCRDGSSAWYVAGVVSHGEGCARPDEAGAYTRVGLYIDWIVAATDSATSADRALSECPGFQCTSHPGRCLPQRTRCNGIVDCLGGEDEKGCSERSRFENLWRSSKSAEDDSPMLQSKREQPHHEQPVFSYNPAVNTSGLFQCTDIIQTIPHSRICDGIQDCEDASDEVNCSCRDRIVPSKVCDGRVHCADLSDERDCFECPNGYFNCRRSQQCIVMEKQCDDSRDCSYGEDERDCAALTSTFNLVIEADGRPKYESEGFLAVNTRGVWSLFCVENKDTLTNKPASSVCHQLGLNGFQKYDTLDIGDVILDITDKSDNFLSMNIAKRSSNCTTLAVTCQPYISAGQETDLGVTKMWEALVRVNGTVTCTGVLLTENWLLASTSCLPEDPANARLVAEVGRQTYPPTMVEINAVERINGSDVVVLHMSEAVNETHSVRPMRLPYRETLEDLTDCLVMGGNRTLPIVLNKQHCPPGKVCVSRSSRPARSCRSAPWSGVAVCNSPDGWLSVGVFYEAGGYCGFQSSLFTDVLKYRKAIDTVIESPVTPVESPACDGFLCMGGLCISNENACDGWPNCPYADDEGDLACATRNGSVCGRDELTCANGQCTKISSWSDAIAQCEDGSDEGLQSKCAGYLLRSAPDKLCDGSRHCLDKSDEDPALCMGKGATYKCASSNVSIPKEFVCDGEEDCTSGDDEKSCVTLQRISKFSQEYEYRNVSYGLSHSLCSTAPTAQEADALCKKEGNGRHTSIAMRLATPKIVQLDHFTSVTLNNITKLVLRSKRPFATLKLAPRKCPVAFVTCI